MKMRERTFGVLMGLGVLSAVTSLPVADAFGEWTGDTGIKHLSDTTIIGLASGQIDKYRYFCIEGVSVHDKTKILKTCASSNKDFTIWAQSYDDLYRQAVYYYATGKKVRVHYANNVWKYEPFTKVYTTAHIVGFSSCTDGDSNDCFGPNNN